MKKQEDADMSGSRRIRTDLALETTERFAEENTEIRGVEVHEEYDEEKDADDSCKNRDGKWGKIHGTATGNVYYDRGTGAFDTG